MPDDRLSPFFALHGELRVRVERPPQRFGVAIYVYMRDGDNAWLAVPDVRGELVALPVNLYEFPSRPTLYVDESVAEGMKREFLGQDFRVPGHETTDHLKDTIQVRDRLLALVEHTLKTD